MKYVYLYLIAAVVFLAADALWLGVIARGFYQSQIGALLLERPRFGVAIVFYALYVVGLLYFAVVPGLEAGRLGLTVMNAALFGFFCYLTYDASNLSTLKGYTLPFAVVDTLWGTFASGATAAIAFLAARGLNIWQA